MYYQERHNHILKYVSIFVVRILLKVGGGKNFGGTKKKGGGSETENQNFHAHSENP